MNKIERFRAMLKGAPVDRVPVGFWFHFRPEHHGGEAMAQAHLDYYQATDLDVMKVMNDTGYAPIGTAIIQEPEDWLRLEPTPLSDLLFQSHLEGLKRIVAALADEALAMTTAFNPYNQAVAIIQHSAPAAPLAFASARLVLLEQLRTYPEPVVCGLQVIAQDLARFYRACITEAGIQGIYYSAQGGERELLTDEEHASLVKPGDLYLLNEIGTVAEFVVGHFCGMGLNLSRFSDYPVQVANWAPQADNLSLTQGRAVFNGLPILGGMDERGPLVHGPREAIRRQVEGILAEAGTLGFMLGAGCTLPGDVDLGNLIYAREVAAELSAPSIDV